MQVSKGQEPRKGVIPGEAPSLPELLGSPAAHIMSPSSPHLEVRGLNIHSLTQSLASDNPLGI